MGQNVPKQVTICFGFATHWKREWQKLSGSVIEQKQHPLLEDPVVNMSLAAGHLVTAIQALVISTKNTVLSQFPQIDIQF